MKRVFNIIIMSAIVLGLIGCGNSTTTSTNETETVEEEVQEVQEPIATKTEGVWNIEPIYELDNIYYPIYNFSDFQNAAIINHKDFYGPYDGGGLVATKNDLFGVLDPSGQIAVPFSYTVYQPEPYNEFGHWDKEGAELLAFNYETYKYDFPGGLGGAGIFQYYLDNNVLYGGYASFKITEIDSPKRINIYNDVLAKYMVATRYMSPGQDSRPTGIDENTSIAFIDVNNRRIAVANNNEAHYISEALGEDYRIKSFTDDVVLYMKSFYDDSTGAWLETPVYYVDTTGKAIGEFEDGLGFTEGYAAVKKGDKWGYINKNGEVVVDYIFDQATPIYEGKAWVKMDGRVGKLNVLDLLNSNTQITPELLSVQAYELSPIDYTKTRFPKLKVKVDNLNIRVSPSTNAQKYPMKAYTNFDYSYYETTEADGYTWYRVGKDQWIADNGEWIELRN